MIRGAAAWCASAGQPSACSCAPAHAPAGSCQASLNPKAKVWAPCPAAEGSNCAISYLENPRRARPRRAPKGCVDLQPAVKWAGLPVAVQPHVADAHPLIGNALIRNTACARQNREHLDAGASPCARATACAAEGDDVIVIAVVANASRRSSSAQPLSQQKRDRMTAVRVRIAEVISAQDFLPGYSRLTRSSGSSGRARAPRRQRVGADRAVYPGTHTLRRAERLQAGSTRQDAVLHPETTSTQTFEFDAPPPPCAAPTSSH